MSAQPAVKPSTIPAVIAAAADVVVAATTVLSALSDRLEAIARGDVVTTGRELLTLSRALRAWQTVGLMALGTYRERQIQAALRIAGPGGLSRRGLYAALGGHIRRAELEAAIHQCVESGAYVQIQGPATGGRRSTLLRLATTPPPTN